MKAAFRRAITGPINSSSAARTADRSTVAYNNSRPRFWTRLACHFANDSTMLSVCELVAFTIRERAMRALSGNARTLQLGATRRERAADISDAPRD